MPRCSINTAAAIPTTGLIFSISGALKMERSTDDAQNIGTDVGAGLAVRAGSCRVGRRAGLKLDTVMALLAMRQHGRVEFVEQQFLAILDHPVESSGELRYDAPDHLEKRTLLPRPETLCFPAAY
jgi:hypothetical protein